MAIINGWYVRPGKLTARRGKLALQAVATRWQDYVDQTDSSTHPPHEDEPEPDAPGVLVSGYRGQTRELFYFVFINAQGSGDALLQEFAGLYTPEYAAARVQRRETQDTAEWKIEDGIATAELGTASLTLGRTTFRMFTAMADESPGKLSSPTPASLSPDREGFLLVTTMANGVKFPAWLNDEQEWLNFSTLEELTQEVSPQKLYNTVISAVSGTTDPPDGESRKVAGWDVSQGVASRTLGDMEYRIWVVTQKPDGTLFLNIELTTPGVKTSSIMVNPPAHMKIRNLEDFLRSDACRDIAARHK